MTASHIIVGAILVFLLTLTLELENRVRSNTIPAYQKPGIADSPIAALILTFSCLGLAIATIWFLISPCNLGWWTVLALPLDMFVAVPFVNKTLRIISGA